MNKQDIWIIIANATTNISWMLPYFDYPNIIVCDGAHNYLKSYIKHTHIVLGDFDSIHSDQLNTFIHAPDQNKTDLQKAIEYADQQLAKQIIILNALDNDFSHTLHNARLLKRFYNSKRPIKLLHAFNHAYLSNQLSIDQIQFFSDTHLKLAGHINDLISLFGFPICTINSSGLQWELTSTTLDFATLDSSRNRLQTANVSLDIKGDCLIVCNQDILIESSH